MSINKLTFQEKTSGDTLAAQEWNTLTNYVNTVVDEINTNNSNNNNEGNNSCESIRNQEKLELNFNMQDYIQIGTSDKPNIMSFQSFLDFSDWLHSHNYGGVSYYDISYVGLNNFTYQYQDYVGLNDLLNIVQEKYQDYLDYLNNGGTPSNPSYPDIEFSDVNTPQQISNNFHTSDFGNNSEWFGLKIDTDSVWLCKRFKYDIIINITDKDKIKLSDLVTIVNQMKNQTGPWSV